jgi:hypothetical protein
MDKDMDMGTKINTDKKMSMGTYMGNTADTEIEAQAALLNPFAVCLSCKQKFVFFRLLTKKRRTLSVYKRTKRACPSFHYAKVTVCFSFLPSL